MSRYARQLSAAQRAYDNASEQAEQGGLLEDPASANEFVMETYGETFRGAAAEVVEGWIYGPQDKFSEARVLREVKELADRYVNWCREEDKRRIRDS